MDLAIWVIIVFIIWLWPEARQAGGTRWEYLERPELPSRLWQRTKMPLIRSLVKRIKSVISYLYFEIKKVFRR